MNEADLPVFLIQNEIKFPRQKIDPQIAVPGWHLKIDYGGSEGTGLPSLSLHPFSPPSFCS